MAASDRTKELHRSTRTAQTAVRVVAVIAATWWLLAALAIVVGEDLILRTDDYLLSVEDLPQVASVITEAGTTAAPLREVPLWIRLLSTTPLVLAAVVALAATWLLGGILRGIGSGTPFQPTVIASLRLLFVALFAGGLLQGLLATAAGVAIGQWSASQAAGGSWSVSMRTPDWPLMTILVGLVVLALTHAFERGAELAEEARGLV